MSIPISEEFGADETTLYSVCMLTSHFSPRRLTITFFIAPMMSRLFRYPTQPILMTWNPFAPSEIEGAK